MHNYSIGVEKIVGVTFLLPLLTLPSPLSMHKPSLCGHTPLGGFSIDETSPEHMSVPRAGYHSCKAICCFFCIRQHKVETVRLLSGSSEHPSSAYSS